MAKRPQVSQTTVDFLRHGHVSGGTYYRGKTDDQLTTKGWQQMETAVVEQSWDLIITSPLHRCLDFAQYLNEQTNTPYNIEPSWQEINFGDWEGKKAEQIDTDDLTRFYRNPIEHPPKNGESFQTFQTRIDLAWNNLINMHTGQHLLVITHAGVIRCLFSLLLKLPIDKIFNLHVDHASITRFQCIHDSPDNFIKLIFHNLTLHLEKIK